MNCYKLIVDENKIIPLSSFFNILKFLSYLNLTLFAEQLIFSFFNLMKLAIK